MEPQGLQERATHLGQALVGPREALFEWLVRAVEDVAARPGAAVALSGGSTPAPWYRWCVETGRPAAAAMEAIDWTVSDERCVPPGDLRSNFGAARRLFLDARQVPPARRHPWPVGMPPRAAASAFGAAWEARRAAVGGGWCSLCLAGMGEDAHLLSLFPGSPVLADGAETGRMTAAVPAPDGGWRLTFTPAALARCDRVVVLVFGAAKARTLRQVLTLPSVPAQRPAQVLAGMADRVTWLLDPEAGDGLPARRV